MKKKLENNLALKIFALVIAVGMWLFVNNVDDPVVTARYSVKIMSMTRGKRIRSKRMPGRLPF